MVIEEFRVELDNEEKELVSNPEKWFLKLPLQKFTPFVDALENWSKCHVEDDAGRVRKGVARKPKSQQGYRLRRLVSSLLRPDKRKPPLCIICFDDGEDVSEACGKLSWSPDFPLFFAVHELCALTIPEVLTVNDPTPLGRKLFETDVRHLYKAFVRGRKLVCNVCQEKGAMVGCCCSKCRRVYHLPCAMRSMCYINYEKFLCFCPKHSEAEFSKTARSLFSKAVEKESEADVCCLCMDNVESQIKLHSVIKLDCCGLRFYHFDCMKNATLIRGQEMRCPACNRPNEETGFEEKIKRQGIYFQTYNPGDEGDDDRLDGEVRSRCYYAMTRGSACNRSCMSTIGPDKYDDSDALNDSVFNPLEALNACITCGVHCHRICAGPPWSTFTPDGDGDEQKWQCEDCRELCSPVLSPVEPALLRDSSRQAVADSDILFGDLNDLELDVDDRVCEQQPRNVEKKRESRKKRGRSSISENSPQAPLRKQPLIRRWLAPLNNHDLR